MNLLKTNRVRQKQLSSGSILEQFQSVFLHVVLIGDNQNDKLKKEYPDFKFYSLYTHVPLCNIDKILTRQLVKKFETNSAFYVQHLKG